MDTKIEHSIEIDDPTVTVVNSWEDWRRTLAGALQNGDLTSLQSHAPVGRLRQRTLFDITFLEIASLAQEVSHTKAQVNALSPYYLLSLQLEGRTIITQGGHEAVLEAGDLTVRNMGRPSNVCAPGAFRQLLIKIPVERLVTCSLMDRIVGRRVAAQSSVGRTVVPFFQSVYMEVEQTPVSCRAGLAAAVLELVRILPLMAEGELTHCTTVVGRYVAMVEDFVEENLGDPDLSIKQLAPRIGVSSRYIQKLFAKENRSLSHYIRERRLQRCRQDLIRPDMRECSITKICFRWGFNDVAHFSRTFKARFGSPPGAFRQRHLNNLLTNS